jgi:hypothetical protein
MDNIEMVEQYTRTIALAAKNVKKGNSAASFRLLMI